MRWMQEEDKKEIIHIPIRYFKLQFGNVRREQARVERNLEQDILEEFYKFG